MAKKQLKKINQPKKYLQGGSNMGSVSMMRQAPYYLGQVGQAAAEEDLATTQNQILSRRQQAIAQKQALKDAQDQQLDAAIQNSSTQLIQAAAADKQAGNLGKFMLPPVTTGGPATTMTMGNGMVNPTTGKALTMTLGKTTGGTQGVNFSNVVSGGATVAGEGAGAAGRVGLMGSNMSALGAAGIGIAANVGGQVIQKRADDNSAYTFTDKERRGNTGGSALASAGTGFGIGATIGSAVPVVGNVVGGLIGAGIGAGIGALKARKENKAAEEEAQRLQAEQAAMRGAFQSAFVNSRAYGPNTGFGLRSSMPGEEATNQYFVAKTGGVTGIQEDRRPKKVPGGKIVPIEGTDAVEFIGRSHERGGVTIDKNTEVEGGETMDQVAMSNNNKQDYIFSKYLKLGGKSFAQRHKEILKGSGSQADIQQLAAMQEKAAGRNPQQIAQYGGLMSYEKGGPVLSKDCPPGTIYNAYTGNCEPFSFSSVSNMVTGKTGNPVNVANNSTPANTTTTKPAIPLAISKPGKKYSQAEKDAGWKYVYDVAKSLGDPFPEVTASQWALESGWGSSNTGTFNPFGQTASKGESGTRLNTPRDPGGGTKKFKNYSSYEEAIQDHINRWAPKYKDAKDPLEALYMIQNHGGAPRYAEGHNNDWEGYVKKVIKISDSRSKTFGVHRGSTYVPDKTKYPKAKGINVNTGSTTTPTTPAAPKLLPPPPVAGKEASFAERTNLPGIGSMAMNEDIQMPEQPKSNITFDPTMTRQERLEKEKPASSTTLEGRPDGIKLYRDEKTGEYIYRDGKGKEIIRGKDRNALENQMNSLIGGNKFDDLVAEQDAAGVVYNVPAGISPKNSVQSASTNNTAPVDWVDQTWIDTGHVKNAAGEWVLKNPPAAATANNVAVYNAPQTVTPAAATANGGPGTTAPTINNQNSTYQNVAKTPGYLDYNDPNTAGGIWSGDRYNKEWRPLVANTMSDAAKADIVINYLNNYTGADADDVKAKLKGKNRDEQIAIITNLATDTKVGPFHNAVFGAISTANDPEVNVATNNPPANTGTGSGTTTTNTGTTPTRRYTPCPPGTYLSTDGTCKQTPEYSKPYDGNIVAAAGAAAQLIPPIYAALNPYERVGAIAGAPSVRGALLGRKNFNAERSQVQGMNTATNEAVTNANTGASGFAIRQAAMAAANKQMLDIAKAEGEVNTELRGKEAVLGQDASKYNADNAMKRDMFNADLKQRQNQYIDERNIGVVDAAANRIAGMANTYNQYKATDHLARVTNANTHSLERDKMYESLLKDSQKQNSQFYGVPDAELRRIAAGLVEEQMGGVGRTGGVRQYISRLGELKSARATKAKL